MKERPTFHRVRSSGGWSGNLTVLQITVKPSLHLLRSHIGTTQKVLAAQQVRQLS